MHIDISSVGEHISQPRSIQVGPWAASLHITCAILYQHSHSAYTLSEHIESFKTLRAILRPSPVKFLINCSRSLPTMSAQSKDGILAVCGSLLGLSAIAVGLRLYARKKQTAPFKADDALAVAALVSMRKLYPLVNYGSVAKRSLLLLGYLHWSLNSRFYK